MRLPWIQVATEVLESDAAELAIRLDVLEDTALSCLVRLFHGMLARADERKPPSASDTIYGTGPVPARILSETARFRGDPEAFSEALQSLVRPVVEPVEGGLRVRGMDRYDAAWGKNRPKEWAEWKRNHPKPNGGGPKPGRSRPGPESSPSLHRHETGPEPARGRNGTEPQPSRTRRQTGAPDADADADADLKPPPYPPPIRAKPRLVALRSSALQREEEEVQQELNRSHERHESDTTNELDLEPMERPWTVDALFAFWQACREVNDIPASTSPTADERQALKAIVAVRKPSELKPSVVDFHTTSDPKARWPKHGYPLAIWLNKVWERHLGPPAERRSVCCACREPGELVASPVGRPICYRDFLAWRAAAPPDAELEALKQHFTRWLQARKSAAAAG